MPGDADAYRMPFQYGGFVFSDRLIAAMRKASLDSCLRFTAMKASR
jgi:hypothetical protein